MREIAELHDASRAKSDREDWYTARIVAMLQAINSKHGKYQPSKFMANGKDVERRAREREQEREPMTGDEVLQRFRAIGWPVIDKRSAVSGQQSAKPLSAES